MGDTGCELRLTIWVARQRGRGVVMTNKTGEESKNGRYRNRTCDPLIKSQLLYRLS